MEFDDNHTLYHDFNTSLGSVVNEVSDWANKTFPDRNDASMFLKLYGEIGEMVESDGNPTEIADVFIMLMDYARRKNVDITNAVRAKLAVNRQRKWITDNNGVNRHVK